MLIAITVTNFSSLTNKWIFFLTQVDFFMLKLSLINVPMTGGDGGELDESEYY